MDRNRRRDRRTVAKLRQMGWAVLVLWECQLRSPESLMHRLARFLGRSKGRRCAAASVPANAIFDIRYGKAIRRRKSASQTAISH
jgi:G:T-mismatch repair DNA endonuclease (very short patch repair protein)